MGTPRVLGKNSKDPASSKRPTAIAERDGVFDGQTFEHRGKTTGLIRKLGTDPLRHAESTTRKRNKTVKLTPTGLRVLAFVTANPGCTVIDIRKGIRGRSGLTDLEVITDLMLLLQDRKVRREREDGTWRYSAGAPSPGDVPNPR